MSPAPAPDPAPTGRSPAAPLWRRETLRRAGAGVLRPGGLDLTDRAAELSGLAPRWRVLDAGCGSGAAVRRLRARHGALAVGLDLDLAAAAGHFPKAPPLVRADMARLPFADAGFHMVLCECVLSLARDPDAVLAEFARVLRPGGRLALSDLYLTGDAPGPAGHTPAAPAGCAAGARPRPELEARLAAAGFVLTRFEDHSIRLRELAARLVLAGEPAAGLAGPCCGAARPGYGLWLARRP
ncbi:MAG: DVU_1556 family methyltransferase [Desulfovibrionaceae bacterium]